MPRLDLVFVLAMSLGIAGCGGETPPPTCTGTSCSCAPNTACDIGDSSCSGASCSLSCDQGATCTGSCGSSCSIDCAADASCDVTVGPSGSVDCRTGSTCTIRCTDSCSVSCSGADSCRIQCAGDTAPRDVVDGSGQCE